jgi:F0F1-type ATP synthase membrane subunit b/b'
MGPFLPPWLLEHTSEVSDVQWLVVRTAGFAALALVVVKFIVPVVRAMLEGRLRTIEETAEQVRSTLAETERMRDDYRERLDHIAEETARRLQAAVAEADQLRRHIEAEARQQSEAMLAQTRAELRREHEKAMAHLRIEFAEDVVEAARFAASRTLTQDRQRDLVGAFVRELGGAA